MKACNAVYHATIPPSAGFVTPNPTVEWDEIPFFVPTKALDWAKPESNPRRAGISAFGFGGTNFHVTLEEYVPDYTQKLSRSGAVDGRHMQAFQHPVLPSRH